MLISLLFVIVCFWLWLHGAFPPKDPPNQQTAIEERGFEQILYNYDNNASSQNKNPIEDVEGVNKCC